MVITVTQEHIDRARQELVRLGICWENRSCFCPIFQALKDAGVNVRRVWSKKMELRVENEAIQCDLPTVACSWLQQHDRFGWLEAQPGLTFEFDLAAS